MEISGCRVLVIDKNRHVRSFLQRELLRDGHEVQAVSDDGFVGAGKRVDYDIVVVDPELLHGRMWSSFEILHKHNPHMIVILHSIDLTPDTLYATIPPGWDDRIVVVEKGNMIALREAILSCAERCCGSMKRGGDDEE